MNKITGLLVIFSSVFLFYLIFKYQLNIDLEDFIELILVPFIVAIFSFILLLIFGWGIYLLFCK
jgi:hypothetical protein